MTKASPFFRPYDFDISMMIHRIDSILGKALLIATLLVAPLWSVCASAASEPDEIQRSVFVEMLLKKDPAIALLGARSISHFYNGDAAMTDYIAERLAQLATPDVPAPLLDSVRWYALLLGETGNARYFDTLTQAREKSVDPNLIKRIDLALTQIGAKQGEQYATGAIDLEAKRTELTQASQYRTHHPGFTSIKSGQSLTSALAILGAPNDMTTMSVRILRGRSSKLVFSYSNAGVLLLTLNRGTPDLWTVIEAVDEVLPVGQSYSGDQAALAQLFGSVRGGMFLDLVQFRINAFRKDPALIKLTAKRLELLTFPADKFEDRANTMVLRTIAHLARTDAEAMKSLRTIAATSLGKETQRAATAYVKKFEKSGLPEPTAEDVDAKDVDEEVADAATAE